MCHQLGGMRTDQPSPQHCDVAHGAVVPAGCPSSAGTHTGVGIQGFNLQGRLFVLSFLKWFGGNQPLSSRIVNAEQTMGSLGPFQLIIIDTG